MPRQRPPNPGDETAEPRLSDGAIAAGPESLSAAGLVLVLVQGDGDSPVWRVTGNTLEHRGLLRDSGGKWNKMAGGWDFHVGDPTPMIARALATRPPAIGDNSGDTKPPRPHYHGHRERVRQRVLASGIEPLQDYELLELLLFYAIPRIDTKPLAKELLRRLGSLGDVFAADPQRLREAGVEAGSFERLVVLFHAVRESGLRLARQDIVDRPIISSSEKLIDYCRTALQHEKTEQFRILFLDRKNVLIRDEVQQRGTVDHTPVYPREVVKRALELGASSLIMIHNHPSGDPTPSRDDIAMTKEVKAASLALGIELHDHLVIGRKGHVSFRSKGLL